MDEDDIDALLEEEECIRKELETARGKYSKYFSQFFDNE